MEKPDQHVIAAVQTAVVASINALGTALLGPNFNPIESSPVSDDEVADLLNRITSDSAMDNRQ